MFTSVTFWLCCFYLSLCLISFTFNLWLKNSVVFTKQQSRYLKEQKFLIIGAGISGLAVGYFFKKFNFNFVIVERAQEIGGTWFLNRYPGAAVDVPSFLYQYSFFPKTDWPQSFNTSTELFRYLKKFAKWAELEDIIRFKTSVDDCEWDDEQKLWKVRLSQNQKTSDEYFNWTFVCTGSFNEPNKPKFENQKAFTGQIIHTGEWPENMSVVGKRVAVIGSGSSAAQTVPGLLDSGAREVVQFQRTASFIIPRLLGFKIPRIFQLLMKIYPFAFITRGFFWAFQESLFIGFEYHNSFLNKLLAKFAHWHRTSTVKDSVLREKLKPEEGVRFGCKRVIVSTAIYEAANDPRYSLNCSKISEFTSSGILTEDNKEIPVDIIVLATGRVRNRRRKLKG
ncbi:unnamed protein product [Oikopleura dioica]|uniref:Flavin-containing monooxygenase n=1 Tax=Oikopleura dioica TaxID=34765 RepID=E4YZS2_OIKDI|nr:unnamed protein product [Oikopleura dioica]